MIGLHGDDVVYEQTTEPPTDDGSALMRQLREASPEEQKAPDITSTVRDAGGSKVHILSIKRAGDKISSVNDPGSV